MKTNQKKLNGIIEKNTPYGYFSYYENDQVFAILFERGEIYEQSMVLDTLSDYIKKSSVNFLATPKG